MNLLDFTTWTENKIFGGPEIVTAQDGLIGSREQLLGLLSRVNNTLALSDEAVEEINTAQKNRVRPIFAQPPDPIMYVYAMRNHRNGFTKIGISKTPKYRERTLQGEEPEIEMLWSIRGSYQTEADIHEHYSKKRIRGEWFKLSNADLKEIRNFCTGHGVPVKS